MTAGSNAIRWETSDHESSRESCSADDTGFGPTNTCRRDEGTNAHVVPADAKVATAILLNRTITAWNQEGSANDFSLKYKKLWTGLRQRLATREKCKKWCRCSFLWQMANDFFVANKTEKEKGATTLCDKVWRQIPADERTNESSSFEGRRAGVILLSSSLSMSHETPIFCYDPDWQTDRKTTFGFHSRLFRTSEVCPLTDIIRFGGIAHQSSPAKNIPNGSRKASFFLFLGISRDFIDKYWLRSTRSFWKFKTWTSSSIIVITRHQAIVRSSKNLPQQKRKKEEASNTTQRPWHRPAAMPDLPRTAAWICKYFGRHTDFASTKKWNIVTVNEWLTALLSNLV